MKIEHAKKCWTTPNLVVYGTVVEITKGGTGWKTNGTGDDLVSEALTPWCSTCPK